MPMTSVQVLQQAAGGGTPRVKYPDGYFAAVDAELLKWMVTVHVGELLV